MQQQSQQCFRLTNIPTRRFFNRSTPPDFDPKRNYYKDLEVSETASQPEIKNAFYRLAQFYHPDRNNGVYQEKFKELTAAYQVLNDPTKRQRYDALRKGDPDPESMWGGFGQSKQSQQQKQ